MGENPAVPPTLPSPAFGRRRWLSAAASAAVLGGAGVVALVRTGGYDVAPARRRALSSFAPWELVVFEHAARRIAAADREGDGAIPTPDDVDVAGWADGYLGAMHPTLRRDLGRLFAYLEHLAPLRLGLAARFTRLSPSRQDAVLAAMERADEGLLRGGFAGLKALVFMGYYRDPRTWPILGYDGPTLGRAAAGRAP